MAYKMLLLLAFFAVVNGLPSTTPNTCTLGVQVDRSPDGSASVKCTSTCPEGEDGFMFSGSAYKRFPTLDSSNQMLRVNYGAGALVGCQLVPLQTTEELAAREIELLEPYKSCRPEEFLATTPTTEEPVLTTAAVIPTTEAPIPTTTTPVPTTTTPVPTTTTPVPTTTTPVPTTTTPVPTTTTPVPTTTTTAAPIPIRTKCPEGFTPVGDSCYLVTPFPNNRIGGWNECVQRGAQRTAVIESQAEQDRLAAVLSTRVWIAFNDIDIEGRFTAPGLGNNFYTSWYSGEPNNYNNDEDCAMMIPEWQYKWNDDNCNINAQSLCETTPINIYKEPSCPVGQRFEDSCYFFSDSANYDTGAAQCRARGGYPVFVNTQKEQDFIATIVAGSVYMGYTDVKEESVFVADNFGVMLYRNWNTATQEPNNANENEHCSEIRQDFEYRWNDIRCDTVQRTLCEIAATKN